VGVWPSFSLSISHTSIYTTPHARGTFHLFPSCVLRLTFYRVAAGAALLCVLSVSYTGGMSTRNVLVWSG
jgi:hypothetical protein